MNVPAARPCCDLGSTACRQGAASPHPFERPGACARAGNTGPTLQSREAVHLPIRFYFVSWDLYLEYRRTITPLTLGNNLFVALFLALLVASIVTP